MELLNLVILVGTKLGVSFFSFDYDQVLYWPPCDEAARAQAALQRASRPAPEGVLFEALHLQAANWDKTRVWWERIAHHHQELHRTWMVGRHVLDEIERERERLRAAGVPPNQNEIYADVRKTADSIRYQTAIAQFRVRQIENLKQVAESWGPRLQPFLNPGVHTLSTDRLIEAAETLVDWKSQTAAVFEQLRADWVSTFQNRGLPRWARPLDDLVFSVGNPLEKTVPPNLRSASRRSLLCG